MKRQQILLNVEKKLSAATENAKLKMRDNQKCRVGKCKTEKWTTANLGLEENARIGCEGKNKHLRQMAA